MAQAQILSWGKCELTIEPIPGSGGSSVSNFPIPVDDSTQLTGTQGDKTEAKIEGGEIVATRTDAANYTLATKIRLHSELTTPPLGNGDGQIQGEYKVTIKPLENTTSPKITLNRCSASAMFNYSSAEGITVDYSFDVLKPDTGNRIDISAQSSS